MRSTTRSRLPFLALVCVFVFLAGCGGGSGSSGKATVAQVAGTRITRQALDYWMRTLFGEDFVAATEQTVPAGLVSEPANNSKCVSMIEAGMSSSLQGPARPTSAQLFHKCQMLNVALKAQALAQLISWQQTIQTAASKSIKVTDAEAQQRLEEIQREQFPKPGEWQAYLNERGWTPAVELLRTKLSLLSANLSQQAASGGEKALAAFYVQQHARLKGKTTCEAGYVVEGCREFRAGQQTAGLSPAELSKAIANLKDGVAHLKDGRNLPQPAGSSG